MFPPEEMCLFISLLFQTKANRSEFPPLFLCRGTEHGPTALVALDQCN